MAGPRALVIFDGTTLDLFNCPGLAAEFGVPEGGKHPKLRLVALLQARTMRWKAAVIGGYHGGENALAEQLEATLGPGQLSLAERGFSSMDRWLRFSAAGAYLLWRVKNAARSVPFRPLRDGSELGPAPRKPRHAGQAPEGSRRQDAAQAGGYVARLVCFTVLTRSRRGRTKTTAIRVLTTLLDPDAFPAAEVAAFTRRDGTPFCI